MKDSQTIKIDKNDVEFLKMISRSLNHQIRLLWNPAPTRRDPLTNPTEVIIVAEEKEFVSYTVYELNKYRNSVSKPAPEVETAQIAEAKHATVTF